MLIDDGLEILGDAQCREMLSAESLGRIAVTIGGLPVILPVNYVWIDDEVVFRTSEGAKLRAASRGVVVAFEIDSYNAATCEGWSVLVIGRASEILDQAERIRVDAAAVPCAFGRKDRYVRIVAEMVSGRKIRREPETLDVE